MTKSEIKTLNSKQKYYTGIGSRETPESLRSTINRIAKHLDSLGYRLRSGGAPGADNMFETAVPNDKSDIYLPWKGFNNNKSELYDITKEAMQLASKHHPSWHTLSEPVKRLMSRNCYQVLGYDLNTPSEFVICWTPNGEHRGGTRQALSVAKENNIPIYNLHKLDDVMSFIALL